MPSLREILADPNYINANQATKEAIFNKYAPLDQNYTQANEATQEAIRQRFGIGGFGIAPELPKPEESGFFRQTLDVSYKVAETLAGCAGRWHGGQPHGR